MEQAIDRPALIATPRTSFLGRLALDAKISIVLLIVLFAYYMLTFSGYEYSYNGFTMFQAARVLVGQGTLNFPVPLRWGNEYRTTSFFGIGMTLAYVPALLPVRVLRPELFAPDFFSPEIAYNRDLLVNDLYRYASWTNPMITALACVFLFLTCRQLGWSRRWSLTAALIAGLASPLAAYARFDYAQNLFALTFTGALWLLLKGLNTKNTWALVGAGLFAMYGLLTRFEYLLALPWLYLLLMYYPVRVPWREWTSQIKNGIAFGIPILLGVVIYQGLKIIKLGTMFDSSYEAGIENPRWLVGLFGVLVSPGKGIFLFFPLTILTVIAAVYVVRKRKMPELAFIGIIITYLILYGLLWTDWGGGWAWGPRFLVAIVPFLTILAVGWVRMQQPLRGWQLGLFGVLTLLSLLACWNGVLFNFLGFYGEVYANGRYTDMQSLENYLPETSPLFANWDFAHRIYRYDLYWPYRIRDGLRAGSFLPLIAFGALATVFLGSAAALARYFKNSPAEETTIGAVAKQNF